MKKTTLLVLLSLTRAAFAAPEASASKAAAPAGTAVATSFRAGAHAEDISPTKFPVPVNGGMKGAFAAGINDPMHARCLALHDGRQALV